MRNGRDLTIKGDLTAAEDMTVDFAIDGNIDLPGNRLVVTEDGQLRAKVTAASVTVHGQFDGHISAERLELAASAVVNAGVVAARFAMHDGAQFTGPVNTDQAKAAGSAGPQKRKT